MRYLLLILLYSFALGSDVYPYFSNTIKQMEFEKYRIYVNEESGERSYTTGGGSSAQMANWIGVIFGNETPQYVSVAKPISTHIEYWYKFEIIQNNKPLTEIDFLYTLGLDEEANRIINDYKRKFELADEITTENYYVNRGIVGSLFTPKQNKKNGNGYYATEDKLDWWIWGTFAIALFVYGVTDWEYYEEDCAYYGNEYGDCNIYNSKQVWENAMTFSLGLGVLNFSKTKKQFSRQVWKYPEYRELKERGVIEQTLSAEQIKSLAESYNRKEYEKIQDSND